MERRSRHELRSRVLEVNSAVGCVADAHASCRSRGIQVLSAVASL